MKFETHNFYCLSCGNRGIPIVRKVSKQHGKFHRKRLYCPTCRCEVNHIECRNDEEVFEFRLAYEMGEFMAEAIDSMMYVEEENSLSKGALSYT